MKVKFLSQSGQIFSEEFIDKANSLFEKKNSRQQNYENLNSMKKMIEINELLLYHMANKIQTLSKNEIIHNESTSNQNYIILEECIQKSQMQIRKHISIEHQMKICLDMQNQEILQLKDSIQSLKQEIFNFQIQKSDIQTTLVSLTQQNSRINAKLQFYSRKNNSKSIKLYSQGATIDYQTYQRQSKHSGTDLKKIPTKTKATHAKLIPDKIQVSLQNVQKTQIKSKQAIWNRRLRRDKDMPAGNHSLNISPRDLHKNQNRRRLARDCISQAKQISTSFQQKLDRSKSVAC